MITLNTENLKLWFLQTARDLPWRHNPSPYQVWVSEVMLQQTQVVVVIPYFLRWMEKFPSIKSLAESSSDEVIKLWEGLGYYSRARNLYEGARYVSEQFNGKLPDDEESLKKIKGLGPYTIGAILSFAFHQKKSAVDGNVIRVLTRYFEITDDVTTSSALKKLRTLADNILPEKESWIFNEGLIELGATVCQKKPRCEICPIKKGCQSFLRGTPELLPNKKKPVQITQLYRTVTVLMHKDYFLIKRGQTGEIMQDLHEFPFFETESPGLSGCELKKLIQERYGLESIKIIVKENLPEFSHSFTRYQVKLRPTILMCPKIEIDGFSWITGADLLKLAFSSGHRKILKNLQSSMKEVFYFD